jgi:hypothetical protein
MTHLHQNVDDMLADLSERSQTETDFVRRLSDAIRRVDEQLLRDVRNVSLQHEVRREAILGELQGLAVRLCALPARAAHASQRAEIGGRGREAVRAAIEAAPVSGHGDTDANGHGHGDAKGHRHGDAKGHGGDWRRAAQAIDEELELTFGGGQPRH